MNFGEKIKSLRKKKGVTQKELADFLNLSQRTIVSYETGRSYPKDRTVYEKLAQYFSCSLNYLYMEDEDENPITDKEEAKRLIHQLGLMFAGGSLSERDKDAVMRAIQEVYWEAKQETNDEN